MVFGNVVFDAATGKAFNSQGEPLRYRWLEYPHGLAPESAIKLAAEVGKILLDFWGEGSFQMVLDEHGYAIVGEKGDGRKFKDNLGNLAVFANQQGDEGLRREIERRLQEPAKK